MTFNRRRFIHAGAAAAGASAIGFPSILRAQSEPIRIGLLTVKTGALASGGIDMERGLTMFLKEKSYRMGGRKVELTVADTGAVPAQARTKMQELVERERSMPWWVRSLPSKRWRWMITSARRRSRPCPSPARRI